MHIHIHLPLPPVKYRWYLISFLAALTGLLPVTTRWQFVEFFLVALVPLYLAHAINEYFIRSPLWKKLALAAVLLLLGSLQRIAVTSFVEQANWFATVFYSIRSGLWAGGLPREMAFTLIGILLFPLGGCLFFFSCDRLLSRFPFFQKGEFPAR